MTINEIIKQHRKKLGLTQKEFADMLSVSDKTVSRWEIGNQVPDALLMPDIAKALKITINELYGIKDIDTKTEENTTSEVSYKINKRVLYAYKIGIILGLVLVVFGSFFLVRCDLIDENNESTRLFGQIMMFSGCGICLLSEIVYKIIYRNEGNTIIYLSEDIAYSGFTAITISVIFLLIMPLFLALRIDYWYEFFVVVPVILFEIMMLYYKHLLKQAGVKVSKTISVISIIIGSVSVVLLLSIFIIFRIVDFSDTSMVSKMLYEMHYVTLYGVSSVEAKVRLYSFLLLSLPLISMLMMNYIELIIKRKLLNMWEFEQNEKKQRRRSC